MFNKAQFFIGIAVSAAIAYGVGYSKAREMCLEALIKATKTQEDEKEEENE